MSQTKSPSIAFKRDLLGCFALQRLAVWVAVTIFTFSSAVNSPLVSAFETYSPSLLFVFLAILLALLGLLYRLRKARVFKWCTLFFFSLAETAIWIGFDVLFQTDVKFFNCTFTLAWTLIVLLLEVIRSGKRSKVVDANVSSRADAGPSVAWIDPSSESTYTPGTLPRVFTVASYDFLRIHVDGSVAFIVVGTVSAAIFAVFGAQFLSAMDLGMSLIFQLVLAMWFALDLRRLDQLLGISEASHGVIYVYIDAVLATGYVVMIVAAIGTMVLFIAAFAVSGPAVKCMGGGYAGCGGCASCCQCNFDGFVFQFRESKCLFFNDEGSSFDCCEPPRMKC